MNTITDVELFDAAKRFAAEMDKADDSSCKLGFMAGGSHVRKRLLQQCNVNGSLPLDETICKLANKVTTELWGSSHLQCFGNLEIKMQQVIKDILSGNDR